MSTEPQETTPLIPTLVEPERIDELATVQQPVIEAAKAVTIESWDDYRRAENMVVEIKRRRDQLGEIFDPIVSQWHKGHKATLEQKRKLDAPYEEAEKNILKPRMTAFIESEERRRREEEARRQEAERRAAEEQQLAEAEALEKAGHHDAAEAVLDEEREVVPPLTPATSYRAPAGAASSYSRRWAAVVDDIRELARAVADGKVPPMALKANQAWLNSRARSDKDAFAVPGVRAVSSGGVSVKT